MRLSMLQNFLIRCAKNEVILVVAGVSDILVTKIILVLVLVSFQINRFVLFSFI